MAQPLIASCEGEGQGSPSMSVNIVWNPAHCVECKYTSEAEKINSFAKTWNNGITMNNIFTSPRLTTHKH